jgi:hypothetical protein
VCVCVFAFVKENQLHVCMSASFILLTLFECPVSKPQDVSQFCAVAFSSKRVGSAAGFSQRECGSFGAGSSQRGRGSFGVGSSQRGHGGFGIGTRGKPGGRGGGGSHSSSGFDGGRRQTSTVTKSTLGMMPDPRARSYLASIGSYMG